MLPAREHSTLRVINEAREAQAKEEFRYSSRLGASLIGDECERKLWLGFRWAKKVIPDARTHRIFERGHIEEERLINDLRRAGIHLIDKNPETEEQYVFTAADGHFVGKLDGVCLGVPEAPKTWHLFEAKGLNQKSFDWLTKKGLEKGKSQHYDQMQAMMGMACPRLERGLYVASNKNTEEIYIERIHFDPTRFAELIAKAERIINATRKPSLHKHKLCDYCDYRGMCFEKETPNNVNCRTCIHSTPVNDGKWKCEKFEVEIDNERQKQGCDQHLYHIDLFPFAQEDATDDTIVYTDEATGETWINEKGGKISHVPF